MRHRLRAGDAEALAARRHCDDGGTVVQGPELVVRDEAERPRNPFAQRSVARDRQLHPVVRGRKQIENSLLGREPARVEHLGRRGLFADGRRHVDAAPDHADLARAELAGSVGERVRGAERQARAAQDPAGEPRRPPPQLDVRAPELDDEGAPKPHCDPTERQPVRVDEVGVARGAPGRAPQSAQHQRHEQHAGRAPAQVPGDAGAVGDPVMAEDERRDDLDLDAAPAHVLDRVRDEAAYDVLPRARIGSRQDCHLHGAACRRCPKTAGNASASSTNA